MTTDNFGSVVVKSNDIEIVKEEKPEIIAVLSTVSKTYG
jgi:hypothetical protein